MTLNKAFNSDNVCRIRAAIIIRSSLGARPRGRRRSAIDVKQFQLSSPKYICVYTFMLQ